MFADQAPDGSTLDICSSWSCSLCRINRRWPVHSQPSPPSYIICLIDYELSLPNGQELAYEGGKPQGTENHRDVVPA